MKVYNHNRTSSCTVELSSISFGRVAVFDDKVTIECCCKALDEFYENFIFFSAYNKNELEPDSVSIMLAPNIQRRRFSIMLYVLIQNGTNTTIDSFVTDTELEERRLVVETILSHRKSISDEIYHYYATEYEPWRV